MLELEKAREFFKNDRFATEAAGITIDEITKDYVRCSMEISPVHRNAVGGVMGGAMFTLADFVFAIATNTEEVTTVTTTAQISYTGACKGERLIGTSKKLRDGKRICFYEVVIEDELGNLVAVVSASGTHISK